MKIRPRERFDNPRAAWGRRRLEAFHDELVRASMLHDAELSTAVVMKQRGTNHFPAPPIPGDIDIVPITTTIELKAEGREMMHCVDSYSHAVFQCQIYIYKVLWPEE